MRGRPHRHIGFNFVPDLFQPSLQYLRSVLGFQRQHSTADVHTDRGWNNSVLCRNHGTDSGADPNVHVRHDGDMFEDAR